VRPDGDWHFPLKSRGGALKGFKAPVTFINGKASATRAGPHCLLPLTNCVIVLSQAAPLDSKSKNRGPRGAGLRSN
jgi:hypothetical protein